MKKISWQDHRYAAQVVVLSLYWSRGLLSIPMGILLMATSKQRLSVLMVTVLSLSIELGQLFVSGRVTETEDLILNALGGMLGAWLYKKYTWRHDATNS